MVAIRRIITFAIVALGLLLFGSLMSMSCAGRDAEWYGTWEGTMDLANPSIEDDAVKRTVNAVRLKINPDGTFSLVRGGMPSTGEHVLNDDVATLRIKKFMNRPIEELGDGAVKMNKELKVKMQDGGTLLLYDSFYGDPVELKMRSQPEND